MVVLYREVAMMGVVTFSYIDTARAVFKFVLMQPAQVVSFHLEQ